jgi:hypothetical protein
LHCSIYHQAGIKRVFCGGWGDGWGGKGLKLPPTFWPNLFPLKRPCVKFTSQYFTFKYSFKSFLKIIVNLVACSFKNTRRSLDRAPFKNAVTHIKFDRKYHFKVVHIDVYILKYIYA